MAPESCNLDKNEPEILKPSTPTTTVASPSMSLKSCEKSSSEEHSEQLQGICEGLKGSAEELKCSEGAENHVVLINRCCICRKRVGLLGFRCRCGDLLCGRHRYSDMHDCSFDYKKLGREEIANANPVVRASKIIKI